MAVLYVHAMVEGAKTMGVTRFVFVLFFCCCFCFVVFRSRAQRSEAPFIAWRSFILVHFLRRFCFFGAKNHKTTSDNEKTAILLLVYLF